MTKRGAEWFKCFPTDFLLGTEGMTPDLVGVYTHLLMRMYQAGGTVRRNDRSVAGAMSVSTQKIRAATDRLISLGKIESDGEHLTNHRVNLEAKSRESIAEVRATSGRTGGLKSAVSRRKSNENKETGEANASSKTNQIREEKRREDIESLSDERLLSSGDDAQADLTLAFSGFQKVARRAGWPVPRELSKRRAVALRRRLSEIGGWEQWRELLHRCEQSDRICSGSWFSLDWVLKPANMLKVREGNYDNSDRPNNGPARPGSHQTLMEGAASALANLERAGLADCSDGAGTFDAGPTELDGGSGDDVAGSVFRLVASK